MRHVWVLALALCVGGVATAVAQDWEMVDCWLRCLKQYPQQVREREACMKPCDNTKQQQPEEILWEYCKSRCVRYRHGQERQLCQFRCQRQFKPEIPQRDPEKELQDCRQKCQTEMKEDKEKMMKCEKGCSEEFERQKLPGGGNGNLGHYNEVHMKSSPSIRRVS